MVGFSALLVGPCQDGHLAAARRDTLQSRCPIGGGEHDRVVVQPRRAAHRPIDLGNGDRRPPRQRHSHERVAVRVRHELTVGGDERVQDVVAADERPRLEFVERPNQELRPVAADVQDACAVRRDRDRACRSHDTGEHDRRANDAWWFGSHRPPGRHSSKRCGEDHCSRHREAPRETTVRLRCRGRRDR